MGTDLLVYRIAFLLETRLVPFLPQLRELNVKLFQHFHRHHPHLLLVSVDGRKVEARILV